MLTHFESEENEIFMARPDTSSHEFLPPGIYSINNSMQGIYFRKINYNFKNVLKFDDNIIGKVLGEISTFWKKKNLFKKYQIPFRTGVLLEGPPGSGKSTAIKLILKEIVELKGIGIIFDNGQLFQSGIDQIRQVQPETPIVVIMEDLENILYNDEPFILNMLDGVSTTFENMVFLATTNFPEQIEDRVKNRPGRFDKRYFIDFPKAPARKQYLQHLIGKKNEFKININKWAEDTDKLSFAHLKELFLSVAFFDHPYAESLERLKNMKPIVEDMDDDYDDCKAAAEIRYDSSMVETAPGPVAATNGRI